MKKRIWAPLIAAALFLLAGCADAAPEPTPAQPDGTGDAELRAWAAGEWICAGVEVTESVTEGLAESYGEALFGICELPAMWVDLELSLHAGGSFSAAFHGESYERTMAAVTKAVRSGLRDYLLAAAEEACLEAGITQEEAFAECGAATGEEFLTASLGMSMEELYETLGLDHMDEVNREKGRREGIWSVEDGKLLLDGSEAAYDTAADTLTLDGRVYTRK